MQRHEHAPHPPQPDDARPALAQEVLEIAIRELLIEKGIFSAEDVRRQIEAMDARTPAGGARLVARFWADEAFRALARADGRAAAEQMGFEMPESPELVFLENTPSLHNVVVCTLCSCYPRMVLGLPPAWYKSREYRSRVVNEPRAVLAEFGTVLGAEVQIKVSDSTAELRYLVVPRRPAGTAGWSQAELARLVTRDSMIGVALARQPHEA